MHLIDNARQATGEVELGSFCTVFAKTELLRLIAQGTPLPEIIKAAGGKLTEVGTTNRTHPRDFEQAIASGRQLGIIG